MGWYSDGKAKWEASEQYKLQELARARQQELREAEKAAKTAAKAATEARKAHLRGESL